MRAGLTPLGADLIELCSYVYVADQTVTRGGVKSFDYADRWRRKLHFRVPVRCPDIWNRLAVRDAVRDLLQFLTDDEYEFEFLPADSSTGLERFLLDEVPPEEGAEFEEVVLFSGGLDSLCGAVDEVLAGQRRVLLFSHRPENRVFARQRNLCNAIRSRLPNPKATPYHFAATVNKGKKLNRDFTQRSRSFLFASMAAVVARLFGLRRIRFYENGVTSLNLPISPQMIGGRTSRTTHPQTLRRFARLFSLLFDTDFAVENPYQWSTKPEILQRLAILRHSDLCAATSSCVHTWTRTEQYPHCGLCSQCVDRRISVLAAGLSESDDPNRRYECDVITGERTGLDLAFVERYVGSAFDTNRLGTAREFAARYPEIAHLVPYTGLQSDETVRKTFDLYRRHAVEVSRVVQAAIAARSETVMHQTYPSCSLLGAVVGRASRNRPAIPDAASAGGSTAARVALGFIVDSNTFEVKLGAGRCFLGNTNEFHLLARLLKARGHYLSVQTLRTEVWNDENTEKNTIQKTVSNLRRKLHNAEIKQVTIDGSQRDHYRLIGPRE